MKWSNKIVLLLLLSCSQIYAQSVKGVITGISGNPIAYCTIGYLHHEIGTLSDVDGKFSIPLLNDSLKISAVGYYSKYIFPTEAITIHITLENKPAILPDVSVMSTNERHSIILGHLFKRLNNFERLVDNLQLAIWIPNEKHIKGKIKLLSFRLRDLEDCYVLRVRFYESQTNSKSPGDELTASNFLIPASELKKRNSVDVDALNIYLPYDGVFVSFEWIRKDPGCSLHTPFFAGTFEDAKSYVFHNYRGIQWRERNFVSAYSGKYQTPYVTVTVTY